MVEKGIRFNKKTLKEQPDELKPRERLMKEGVGSLSHAELIAILLRTGRENMTAVELAEDLLASVGGLSVLARIRPEELADIKGVGVAKACQILAGIELGRRVLVACAQPQETERFTSPERVYDVFGPQLMGAEEERVYVVYLNTKLAKIGESLISRGGLNQAIAEPREIFKEAVRRNAFSIILIHNHPSGDPFPSEEDKRLTLAIKEFGKSFGIPLTDHIIIGEGRFYSFESGKVTVRSLREP